MLIPKEIFSSDLFYHIGVCLIEVKRIMKIPVTSGDDRVGPFCDGFQQVKGFNQPGHFAPLPKLLIGLFPVGHIADIADPDEIGRYHP